jgi:hypothetical protein
MLYALFKDGEQVSKSHSTRRAVEIEAFEAGIVIYGYGQRYLPEGYEIKEVKE